MRHAQITFTVYVPLGENDPPAAELSPRDLKTLLLLGLNRYVSGPSKAVEDVFGEDSVYTVAVDELSDSVAAGKTAHLLQAAAEAVLARTGLAIEEA